MNPETAAGAGGPMSLVLLAPILLLAGGLASLVPGRRNGLVNAVGAGSCVIACAAGFAGALLLLAAGGPGPSRTLSWNAPLGGSFTVAADGLTSFFLLLVFGISAVCALYGARYLAAWDGRKGTGPSWLFFNLLVASMATVCLARNALLFLVAWEAMSLSSYFLVMFESERPEVRKAGWTYMVATQLGTVCLLALFVLMAGPSGSLEFADYRGFAGSGTATAGIAFLLALVGFGTKAGLMPMHIWLPEAHPAAPSHVSALMSGMMIKTGIYGLLRVLTFLGTPETWWGWTLVAMGLLSGVLGVLFALAQHDLKRLLAYHSVENIGIITLGLGMGLLGRSAGNGPVAALAYAGCLLHVANHALFKGLLFLGAGAVQHAAHTLEIDRLGGLAKNMKWTAASFLVGSAAICGLPPLNGFVSEFLIYLASFRSSSSVTSFLSVPGLLVIGGLALIGGLAAACFAKAFGIIFLGEPREEEVRQAHECGAPMRASMAVLAAACVFCGLAGPLLAGGMGGVVASAAAIPEAEIADGLRAGAGPLRFVTGFGLGFLLLAGALAGLRRLLLSGRRVEAEGTWDCGYSRPTARMQYTASSFAQPIVRMFRFLRMSRREFTRPAGLLPSGAGFATHTPDVFKENLWRPAFAAVGSLLSRVRGIQHGRIQVYVLYVALTLLALLLWRLG
jgi:formate hydrogenlyase subunit 3/multisubunit Na+/H+ antiporter MnhD subunit